LESEFYPRCFFLFLFRRHLQETVVAAATKNIRRRHQEKQNQVTQQLQRIIKKRCLLKIPQLHILSVDHGGGGNGHRCNLVQHFTALGGQ